MINVNKNRIAIIGLGYVGLPLAVEFSKKYKVFGFDININRLNDLKNFKDTTLEITPQVLKSLISLKNNNRFIFWNFLIDYVSIIPELLRMNV